jgi:RimJ/RimL family protein N-acetyltransferase
VLPDQLNAGAVTLRPFALGDAEDVFSYAQDPEWSRNLPLPNPYQRRHADEFVARSVLLDRGSTPNWAIVLDENVVGAISLRFHLDRRVAELGYSVARAHWGKGIATASARHLISTAFQVEAALIRVRASTIRRNEASARVLSKLGMRLEGELRSNLDVHGELHDQLWFGVMRSEWAG